MASVVAACLACQDAGVPIEEQVAGISVGIVEKGGEYRLLTDITGKVQRVAKRRALKANLRDFEVQHL